MAYIWNQEEQGRVWGIGHKRRTWHSGILIGTYTEPDEKVVGVWMNSDRAPIQPVFENKRI